MWHLWWWKRNLNFLFKKKCLKIYGQMKAQVCRTGLLFSFLLPPPSFLFFFLFFFFSFPLYNSFFFFFFTRRSVVQLFWVCQVAKWYWWQTLGPRDLKIGMHTDRDSPHPVAMPLYPGFGYQYILKSYCTVTAWNFFNRSTGYSLTSIDKDRKLQKTSTQGFLFITISIWIWFGNTKMDACMPQRLKIMKNFI